MTLMPASWNLRSIKAQSILNYGIITISKTYCT